MNTHSYESDRAVSRVATGDTADGPASSGESRRDGSPPAASELAATARLFAALGDRTRLTLLTALAAGPACVGELAALTDVTPSCVSHQLRYLREMRLVRSSRRGRQAVYRLADSHVETLLEQAREHVLEGSEHGRFRRAGRP